MLSPILPPVLCPESLQLVERFDAAFQLARMQTAAAEWPEQGVEVAQFGGLTAIRVKGAFLRHKCLLLGMSQASVGYLNQATYFFREAGVGCVLTLPASELDDATFDALVASGMRCAGTTQARAQIPSPQEAVPSVHVRLSLPEERGQYLDLYQRGVLPEFRQRGVHGALIRARVHAAFTMDCELVLGGGALFGTPMRNYARQGFDLLPLGTVWSLVP